MTQHSAYECTNPFVLYIHGFNEDQTKDTVEMVVKSYTTRDEYNFVLLDWSYTAADSYPMVVENVQPVSLTIDGISLNIFFQRKIMISSVGRTGWKVFIQCNR